MRQLKQRVRPATPDLRAGEKRLNSITLFVTGQGQKRRDRTRQQSVVICADVLRQVCHCQGGGCISLEKEWTRQSDSDNHKAEAHEHVLAHITPQFGLFLVTHQAFDGAGQVRQIGIGVSFCLGFLGSGFLGEEFGSGGTDGAVFMQVAAPGFFTFSCFVVSVQPASACVYRPLPSEIL